MSPHPIGLFDSGVGGLTVWREIVRVLPHQDLIYFADQAHCPYGVRPLSEIRQLAIDATRFLLRQNAQVIVVACNTASAAALDHLRRTFPQVPFIGMEPAVKPAAERTRARKIGVLATRGTLEGDLYNRTRARVAQNVTIITQIAEGLVEKIEQGEIDSLETEKLVRRYVEPMRDAGVDEIVLGCTHYPFVAPLIQRIVGEKIALIDSSAAVARQVVRVIDANGLGAETHPPVFRFYTSGDLRSFHTVMKKLIAIDALIEPAP